VRLARGSGAFTLSVAETILLLTPATKGATR